MTLTFTGGDMTVTKILSDKAACLDFLIAASDIALCSFTTGELSDAYEGLGRVLMPSSDDPC